MSLTKGQADKIEALFKKHLRGGFSSMVDFEKEKRAILESDKKEQEERYALKLAQARAEEMKKAIRLQRQDAPKQEPRPVKRAKM